MDVTGKKVLYVSYDGMTDPLGQSQVIPYLRELTKEGYQFTLLSVEKKERFQKSGEAIRQLLTTAGIKWETLIYTGRPPILSKIYDQWQLNKAVAKLHQQEEFDMLHCRSYVAAEAGMKLLLKEKVPYLFDMRGFWVDERVDSGLWNLKNPLYKYFYRIYKKKEKNFFSLSHHIISLTEKGKEELIGNYHIPPEKVTVIPCCADLAHFDYHKISRTDKDNLRNKLGFASSTKVLTYLGSLGGWYMVDEMLDFFAVLKRGFPDLVFLFITHDDKESILSKAIAKGIEPSAIIVQPASRNEVPLYISVSDWSVFFIKDKYSKKASSPTKQGEIMAMGIPVICNDIGDTGSIVVKTNAGIMVDGFNSSSYAKAVEQLKHLVILPESIRAGACLYYDLRNGVEKYKKVYKEIIK
jgi:glycosyltransferase involved in cell wall biosynthesis